MKIKRKIQKGQGAVEYLIIIGFVTFAVIAVLGIAYLYAGMIRNKIKINQMETLANKIIDSAESVFYSGEPSKTTIIIYIPKGTQDIAIAGNEIVITMSTSSGTVVRLFKSNVLIEGSVSPAEGTRMITLTAQTNSVLIS